MRSEVWIPGKFVNNFIKPCFRNDQLNVARTLRVCNALLTGKLIFSSLRLQLQSTEAKRVSILCYNRALKFFKIEPNLKTTLTWLY